MDGLQLARPGPQHLELLAHQLFLGVDHPPFESEAELIECTRTVNDEVLILSLFIILHKTIIGVVRAGVYADKPSILQFNLLPPHDQPESARPILDYVVAQLRRVHPALTYAVYEENFRPLFESLGCQTWYSVKYVEAPIVERAIETSLSYRLAVPDDLPRLARLIAAAYALDADGSLMLANKLFQSSYSFVASFVGERAPGGELASASMVIGRQGQKKPTLEHAMTHPEEQRKNWATTLVQASMNVLAPMGCTHFSGLATTNNHQVPALHRRVGFVQTGSVIYAGRLADAPADTPAGTT